jgi:hypothetical protein
MELLTAGLRVRVGSDVAKFASEVAVCDLGQQLLLATRAHRVAKHRWYMTASIRLSNYRAEAFWPEFLSEKIN